MNRCIGYFAYFVAWPLASDQVCKLKQCVLFFCTHVNNENPTFLPTVFTVSRSVTGWTVVESGKHIWLYAFTTLHRLVSVSQKCTDLCTDNFEINLIGQLPVALEAGSVLSRVALWGCFEEQILTQFLLLCNRNTIRNKTYSVFAQREDGQSCTLVHTIKLPRWRSVYFLTRMP